MEITQEELDLVEEALNAVEPILKESAGNVPPNVAELVSANKVIETAATLPQIQELKTKVQEIENLMVFLGAAENETRQEIKDRSEGVINEINVDIQTGLTRPEAGSRPFPPRQAKNRRPPEHGGAAFSRSVGRVFYPLPPSTAPVGNAVGLLAGLDLGDLAQVGRGH